MTTRMFFRLLILVAVLSGVAYLLNRQPGKVSVGGYTAGESVFQQLDVNGVQRIDVASMFTTSVLVRAESGWVVETLHGYPAKFSQIVSLLRTFHDLKVGQILQGGDRMLESMGLSPSATSFDYLRVTLEPAIVGKPVSMTIGALKHHRDTAAMGMGMPQGRFMRVADGPVLLVDEIFSAALPRSEDWIDLDVLRVSHEGFTAVTVSDGGNAFTLRRNDDMTYSLDDAGESDVIDQSAALTLFQGLEWLRVDTVISPEVPDEALGLDAPAIVSFTATDGLVYSLLIGTGEQAAMVRPVKIAIRLPENTDNLDPVILSSKRLFDQWRYMIPSRRADQVLPLREALLVKSHDTAEGEGESPDEPR